METDYHRFSQLWTLEVYTAVSVVVVLLLIETAAILLWNDGMFVYILDDPYIHFALSENIASGHFGVNLGEVSAPSSSILWPVILSPLVGSLGSLSALFVNVPATLVTAGLFGYLARKLRSNSSKASAITVILAATLVLVTNIVGLVFTGMEHSLQALLSVLTVVGLYWALYDDNPAPRWLWVVIIVAPLIRYENAALSVPALAALGMAGHRRGAFVSSTILFGLMGGYSLFLHNAGLSFLPTSVFAKTGLAGGWWSQLLERLVRMVELPEGIYLSIGGVGFAGVVLSSQRRIGERLFGGWGAAMIGLHALFGRFGWGHRYEIYVWAATLVSLLLLYRSSLRRFFGRASPVVSVAAIVMLSFLTGVHYIHGLAQIPRASHEIYLQQYQMHRFLTDHYQAPAAVHDLGWTSYRNDHYVLDLAGLANLRALRLRQKSGAEWRREAVRPYADSVRAALIYAKPAAPGVPTEWTPVATLQFDWRSVAAASNTVYFYALDSSAVPDVRKALRDFQSTLPPDATLEFLP